jgi:uncharacterized protein YkwD
MRSLFAGIVVATALLVVPAGGQAAGIVSYQPGSEQQVLVLLNQVRMQHGLSALAVSAPLRSAARAHSADMLQQGYFDHDSRGETWSARIARYLRSPLVGENIAMGQGSGNSAAGIVSQWMRSGPHRAIILNAGLHASGSASRWARSTAPRGP